MKQIPRDLLPRFTSEITCRSRSLKGMRHNCLRQLMDQSIAERRKDINLPVLAMGCGQGQLLARPRLGRRITGYDWLGQIRVRERIDYRRRPEPVRAKHIPGRETRHPRSNMPQNVQSPAHVLRDIGRVLSPRTISLTRPQQMEHFGKAAHPVRIDVPPVTVGTYNVYILQS